MKGCFLLQRKFAPIGHEIIKYLHELGVDEFCAYVGLRTAYDFLCTQKDIPYTSLLLDEDIYKKIDGAALDCRYLQNLEWEYGIPNLWPYLYIDRVLMHQQLVREYPYNKPLLSHENMQKAVQVYAREIITFLDREKPDFFVTSIVGSLGSSLLYHIAQKRGIPTFTIDSTRIGNGNTISRDFRTFSFAETTFKEIQTGTRPNKKQKEAEQYVREFRKNPTPYVPEYTPAMRPIARSQQFAFLLPSRLLKSIRWATRSFLVYLKKTNKDYTDEKPFMALWDRFTRKMRGLCGYSDLYKKSIDEPFVFFALHMEPETATMLYAPHYTNQQELIRQVARALPVGMKLYVKEHPFMVTYRPRRYYKEILKIPNVKLIDPAVSAYDLTRQAKLIITTTGTSAWEGVLFGKPAITFGDVFYNVLSMVKRCGSFEELPYLVKQQLESFHYNEVELINFIGAILEESVDVDLINLWEKADQGDRVKHNKELMLLAELIVKKLGLAPKIS